VAVAVDQRDHRAIVAEKRWRKNHGPACAGP
jgi:hypothetical protein